MRIKKLEMKNFRGFDELTIEFPEKGSAVFVGINGAGKTSILDCTNVLLHILWIDKNSFDSNDIYNPSKRPFAKTDVKRNQSTIENSLILSYKGENFTSFASFRKSLSEENLLEYKYNPKDYFFGFINTRYKNNPQTNLPFFSYYSTYRHVQENINLSTNDISSLNQFSSITPRSYLLFRDYDEFFGWFRSIEDQENEKIRFNNDINYRNRGLETVRKAIKSFLPNFSNPRVQRQPHEELIVEKNEEKLSLSNLSHGEKAMFAMVGDIARRLSIANPSLDDPLNGEGVVLIDEIELHLHPSWQRTIVPRLEKTFPNIQFILTTHSPQVLSTIKKENVFILEDFKLVDSTPNTEGKDSNSILYDIFGISERPKKAKEEFQRLYELIDNGENLEETKEEYEKMKKKYGEFDPEILRAGIHLDF